VKFAAQRTTPRDPAAWLFKAVRNGAINAGLAQRRRRRHEARAASAAAPWFDGDASARPAQALDPESAQAALAGLPLAQREVIVAHLWAGLTFEQIADVSGMSASSAHRSYQAGLRALRERLGVQCPTNPSRPTRN
jgi:RNA polymerase sigma-70 factor (ECF subfamily)